MRSILPTDTQIKEFKKLPDAKPIVMINFLKFRDLAEGGKESGQEVYNRYAMNVAPMLSEVGGRLLWAGAVGQVFIGTDKDEWDQVMLVEYPSPGAFLKMISMPEYEEAHKDRDSGLENSALLASTTVMGIL